MKMHKKPNHKNYFKRPLKEFGLFMADILYNAVVIIVLVVLIRTFLISPFRVIGSSMADTLHNDEFILIDKLSYHLGEPSRGDPIVFLPPITNKYSYKFNETVNTDDQGLGMLDISNLQADKKVFYCQNELVRRLWFCQDRVRENDLIYFQSSGQKDDGVSADLSWNQSTKKLVSDNEIDQKAIAIQGRPNEKYSLRIYNSTGPEFFVKRIVGIPGDIIRIENGRTYLKALEGDEFVELDEVYLNEENRFHTYFKKTPGENEFKVPEGHYFALGDNRNHSNDSRHWFSPIDETYTPYISEENISGRVLIVLWPPENLRLISGGVLESE